MKEKSKKFTEAGNAFWKLLNNYHNKGKTREFNIPKKDIDNLFGIAALAVAKLNSFDEEHLLNLEKEVIPYRLISGGVLRCANSCLEDYFLKGIKELDWQRYEHLSRVCHSAQILYDKDMFRI